MVTRGATGWRLPVAVLVGGLLAGGLLIFYLGLHAEPTSSAPHSLATVVDSAPCGPPDARDTVQVEVAGRSEQVPLDGCGNLVGAELPVELEGELARLAGTGPSPNAALVDRLSALLLVLAGLAGGLLTMVVGQRRVS